jgi:coenzyme F420-reducing hydrogenase gamma subunit
MTKLKIAVFDLTDCEGCELEFLNFKEKFSNLLEKVEILNWRLISDDKKWQDIDISFVEGTPIKNDEINLLKNIRNHSKYVVALGTCAATGGIPALLDPKKREEIFKRIYPGKKYIASNPAKPISNYINIDFVINGCPVNVPDIERFVSDILNNKIPSQKNYPVCLACKSKQNQCLLLEGKKCMGPLTKAGCNAICPSFGLPCFGCLGEMDQANTKALKKRFQDLKYSDKDIENWISTTWKNIKDTEEEND